MPARILLLLVLTGLVLRAAVYDAQAQRSTCPTPAGRPVPAFSFDIQYQPGQLEALAAGQILAYLNTAAAAAGLAEALAAAPLAANAAVYGVMVVTEDVTGDSVPEVLVQFGVSYLGGWDGLLLLFGCAEGAYVQWFAEPFFGWVCPTAQGFSQIVDANGNGIREIYHTFVENAGAGGCWSSYRVYEWNGTTLARAAWDWAFIGSDGAYANCGFAAYVSAEPRTTLHHAGAHWRFDDVDADSVNEVLVFHPSDAGSAIFYPCAEIWEWADETTLHLTCIRRYVTPDMLRANLGEVLATAEDTLYCGYLPAAASFYRQIIANPDLPGFPYARDTSIDERAYLTAFAYYRLVQISAISGDAEQAQTDYASLRRLFPQGTIGYAYAELARIFWEAFSADADLQTACAVTQEYADARLELPADGARAEAYYFANGYWTFEYDPDNLYLGCPVSSASIGTLP